MQFLYYLPKSKNPRNDLEKLGLKSRFPGELSIGHVIANGPDQGRGSIVSHAVSGLVAKMDGANQTWVPAPKMGAESPPYWIGWWTDSPPTEADLARDTAVVGHRVELLVGEKYLVPLLREWREADDIVTFARYTTKLPQVMRLDDATGEPTLTDVISKYKKLWDDSWEVHNALYYGAEIQGRGVLTKSLLLGFACQLLEVNYRVGLLELSALSLMSEDTAVSIIRAGLDLDTYEAALKNRTSRLEPSDINSDFGSERLNTESHINTPIVPQLAS